MKTAPKKYRHFVLSGLLRCGDCGGAMCGCRSTSKTGSLRYLCRTYGERGKTACYCNSIAEAPLVEGIVNKIQELYLAPKALRRLRTALEKGLAQNDQAVAFAENLQRHVERIYRQLGRLEQKRASLESELERLNQIPNRIEQRDLIDAAIGQLQELGASIGRANREELSTLLTAFVDRIELHFDHQKRGKLTRSTLQRGDGFLRPAFEGSNLSKTAPHCVPRASNGHLIQLT